MFSISSKCIFLQHIVINPPDFAQFYQLFYQFYTPVCCAILPWSCRQVLQLTWASTHAQSVGSMYLFSINNACVVVTYWWYILTVDSRLWIHIRTEESIIVGEKVFYLHQPVSWWLITVNRTVTVQNKITTVGTEVGEVTVVEIIRTQNLHSIIHCGWCSKDKFQRFLPKFFFPMQDMQCWCSLGILYHKNVLSGHDR